MSHDIEMPAPSARARELREQMLVFLRENVLPAEADYAAHRAAAGWGDHTVPPVVERLKEEHARAVCGTCFCPRSPV